MRKKTNRRKVILVLIFLFTGHLPLLTWGAEKYKVGDKLFVSPTLGVNMRKAPDIKASILTHLNFNTLVTIVADSLPAKPFQLSVPDFNSGKLTLQGHWVKVTVGNTTGYIFDGMLSHFKGLKPGIYEEEPYYIALFGKPRLQIIKKSKNIQGRKLDYETKIITYPRGLVVESTFFDDCYDEVYTFNISFNETYWLVHRLLLDADAVQNVKFKKEKDKTILSFYSCT